MYAPAGVKTNHNEFPIPDTMRAWVLELCRGVRPEDVAASAQKLLDDTRLTSVERNATCVRENVVGDR